MAIIKTDKQAKSVSIPGRHRVDGMTNLYLRVVITAVGSVSRTWTLLWSADGKPREKGLGSAATLSLAGAREKARTLLQQIGRGLDPIAEAERARMTFKRTAERLIESMAANWNSAKTKANWELSLYQQCQPFGDKAVGAVSVADILGVLGPIWHSKPETARKLRQRIEALMDFAKARGWRPADSANPAGWKGHLQHLLAKQAHVPEHHSSLPYSLMPAFVTRLRAEQGVAARGVELIALTLVRYSQAHFARVCEFDLDAGLWTVPPSRSKRRKGTLDANKPHQVPLTGAAVAYVRAILAETGATDPNARLLPLGTGNMRRRLAALTDGMTAHGMRSSFKDWASDQTTFRDEISEEILGHEVGDDTRRAYRRGAQSLDQHVKILDSWAEFLASKPSPKLKIVEAR
ncbi:integrase arm-type DNA-binding domain-containing protein [Mesorhizobium sp. LHD-90]|uniref:tyrosine-type recombinase/integrase n=1 Tax=Mesorhizobium sp. LHD-90 TaxID=3071414 RepID=UPI0027E0EA43|nr:integrase arm-type DNA-binding domain-containing protein [Mesorhizobium sp. LHD-90]MDQ6438143.1 integrase arm-type DNA-binding domain-containing protein [Mesorhizobium sp. LHD-90]